MSPVKSFREFINERLTAAAEEIFRVFEQTVVQYEEEINRQQRLLDTICNPRVLLHEIVLPQQHVSKEEAPSEQQCYNQERSSSLDQEDPELPPIKEEQEEELSTNQDVEKFVLKQDAATFTLTLTYEKDEHCGDKTVYLNPDVFQSAAKKESTDSLSIKSSEEPETTDLAESQAHRGGMDGDFLTSCSIHLNQKSLIKCETCGKLFKHRSDYVRHQRIHTGARPYSCNFCGKNFTQASSLKSHKRIHTGEKPYSCNICGKRFNQTSTRNVHKRIHTGEKPYSCNTCGQRFIDASMLKRHMRKHTGDKPFLCITCGRRFFQLSHLKSHSRIHTGERPYSCETCGKNYRYRGDLSVHMRTHTESVSA